MIHLLCALFFVCMSEAVSAKEIQLTIMHTTDLHAKLVPHISENGKPDAGGVARLAYLIKMIRAEESHTVLLDAGDLIQGSPFGYLTDGTIMMKFLSHLNYDAWVLGNHDFEWGAEKLNACLAESKTPVLAANLQLENATDEYAALSRIRPYVMLERDDLSIAVIGATTPGVPSWVPSRLLQGFQFSSAVPAVKKVLRCKEVQAADIRVLVAHQGQREKDDFANEINALASECQELDVIIGGHTHKSIPDLRAGGVLYTQAGYWGENLGVVKLLYDDQKKQVVKKAGLLIPIESSVQTDTDMENELAFTVKTIEKALEKNVGILKGDFYWSGSRMDEWKETPLHNLVSASIADALNARNCRVDAVIHGILNRKADMRSGSVSFGDLFNIIPYDNTLVVVPLTMRELSTAIEETCLAPHQPFDPERRIWGLMVDVETTPNGGARVTAIRRQDGTPIRENERVNVVFNSYDASSAGQRLPATAKLAAENPGTVHWDINTRKVLADYLEKQKVVQAETHGWIRVSRRNTAMPPSITPARKSAKKAEIVPAGMPKENFRSK